MNRNKLLDLFSSNLANAIVHEILEKAIDKREIAQKYRKELRNSFEIAKIYREKINPLGRSFPQHDISKLKKKIINRVKAELNSRIRKGYEDIDISLVEGIVDRNLKELKVI